MFICHACIENFRALQKVKIPLNRFSVLLGENDVGKTSFLFALDRFFSGKKISDETDFFRKDTSLSIVITLSFSDFSADGDSKGFVRKDGSIVIQKTFAFDKPPIIKAIMDDGTLLEVSAATNKAYFSGENFHFIPVRRDLSVQFTMSKTALFGKTLRAKMRNEIEKQENKTTIVGVETILKEALEQPKQDLEVFLKQQMHNDGIELLFDELKIDPVEGVSFQVKLSDDKVKDIIIENRGAGTQNNLIIALFRLVASLNIGKSLIFAMEEPENSLHPKAQRQLLSVLQDIGNQSQVIVTTHSPVFLERSKFESNIILTRTMKGNTIAKTFNPLILNQLRSDLGIRPSDALLRGGGNCAILVEGNTEEDGFPIFMEMLGISEFKLGIAIINMRGSDSDRVRNTVRLLQAYDIPCVIVLDKDAEETASNMKRESKIPNGLNNIRRIFCFKKGSIEDYYPLDIVAEVINRELKPKRKILASDFDASKHGNERLNNFSDVMFKNGAGSSVGYLKRYIGLTGTKLMKERRLCVPDELKVIFDEVTKIAQNES